MDLEFYKYQGSGNDFIMIDDRENLFPGNQVALVKFLCDRRFGIGADGLILLRARDGYDFSMIYFNADGKEGSLCGNGGRCITAFARKLGLIGKKARFMASDGEHLAEITGNEEVRLKFNDVLSIETGNDYYFLNTGSPHYVKFLPSVDDLDVFNEGRKIRYGERFMGTGTNVDFVADNGNHIYVRTYERGVENETLACGTGVVASALCAMLRRVWNKSGLTLPVKVLGGQLSVQADQQDGRFSEIWLEGPAAYVFHGHINTMFISG